MVITGRRIRNLESRMGPIAAGQVVVIGLTDLDRFEPRMRQIGLPLDAPDGTTVLPAAVTGPISRYNAEGKWWIRRDQPMETAYRQVEWTWYEFRGRDNRVEMTGIKDVPYRRYPRTLLPPPSIEFTLTTNAAGERLLITQGVAYTSENRDRILHTVNLFLEIFRECNVMDVSLTPVTFPEIRRVNWRILPPGRRPWDQLQSELEPVVRQQRPGNQRVVWYRLRFINGRQPDFVAVGEAGFNGYLVFGFQDQNLYILESIFTGNATYVFEDDWQVLSRRTKAEILEAGLQKDRIIHVDGWEQRVTGLFA